MAHQDEVVRTLEKALETANMPHMLFYGPPGTGKTTCALAICRQLYGPDLFKSRVLELNASDERGISVVRNKIKGFASTAVGAGVPGYPSPPYKILILDEVSTRTHTRQRSEGVFVSLRIPRGSEHQNPNQKRDLVGVCVDTKRHPIQSRICTRVNIVIGFHHK